MMKTNTTYLLLILFLITIGCNKEEPEPMVGDDPIVVEDPNPEDQIELSYPLKNDDVHYCCFTLDWEDTETEGEYQVQISENSSFSAIVFDTIVNGTSIDFPSFLEPDSKYFWRVIPDDVEASKTSEFRIIDYVALLSGTYEATINIYRWSMGSTTKDTTHQTTLYISKGNDENALGYTTDHEASISNMPFAKKRHESFVKYELYDPHPTHNNYLKYYFYNDSIYIYSQSYGNGGGGHHSIKAIRK